MKTTSVRDFLRGEYKNATEPVVVMNHSRPIGIWQPVGDAQLHYMTTNTTSDATVTFTMDTTKDWPSE